jgi:hypothetical protein
VQRRFARQKNRRLTNRAEDLLRGGWSAIRSVAIGFVVGSRYGTLFAMKSIGRAMRCAPALL